MTEQKDTKINKKSKLPKIIRINGTRFISSDVADKKVDKKSVKGYVLDNVHIVIHKTSIDIRGKVCFMCGKVHDKKELRDIEKHHAIPKFFSPFYDIFIPLCSGCHHKFNDWMIGNKNGDGEKQ